MAYNALTLKDLPVMVLRDDPAPCEKISTNFDRFREYGVLVSLTEEGLRKGIEWFNASPPFRRLFGVLFKPYNLFNRNGYDLKEWGFGLLQIGSGHLFYVGTAGFYLLFIKLR